VVRSAPEIRVEKTATMSDIAFSLLIPTRNRVDTAAKLVRHALAFFPADFEVVVQDCGTADGEGSLSQALGDVLADPRLNYAHTGHAASMTENWNNGIARCRGEYVAVLGDDDHVSSELPAAIAWMKANGVDALVSNTNYTHYHWPDHPDPALRGTYQMHRFTGEVVAYDSRHLLEEQVRVFSYQAVRTTTYVYGGVVRRKYLERLRELTGQCFQGYTPDVYTGHYLTTLVPKTHWVDFPLFVPGSCARSNAAAVSHGKGMDDHKREFKNVDWPDIVPLGQTCSVYVTEGVTRALRTAGRDDLMAQIKWADLYISVMNIEPAFRWTNLRRYWSSTAKELGWSAPKRVAELGFGLARRVVGSLRRRRGYLDPNLAMVERPLFEKLSDVADVAALDARLEEAMDRQGTNPPWPRSSARARATSPAAASSSDARPTGGELA
jgi:glycosyltransferase involved in cell wall biosynthesis